MKSSFLSQLRIVAVASAVGAASFAGTALADEVSDWPRRDVNVVYPFAPGSGTDATLRLLFGHLEDKFGKNFIIDNRAGAGGAIGVAHTARQAPDGYTIGVITPGPGANYINSYKDLPYNPLTDFDHVMQLTGLDMLLIARKDLPAHNLAELAELAKKDPGKITAGNPGVGSYGHMAQLTYADQAGISFTYVPYRGGAPIVQDLLSQSVDIAMDTHSSLYQQQIDAGTIKVLGFATLERNPQNPDVPTFLEQGVDFRAQSWVGLVMPKGTNPGIIAKLNEALVEFMNQPDTIEKIKGFGTNPVPTDPASFSKLVVDEEAKWRETIKKYDIRSN